ncbi:MAG: hypothetical protein ChlgKO_11910 [Chlamydiales bacterium]
MSAVGDLKMAELDVTELVELAKMLNLECNGDTKSKTNEVGRSVFKMVQTPQQTQRSPDRFYFKKSGPGAPLPISKPAHRTRGKLRPRKLF